MTEGTQHPLQWFSEVGIHINANDTESLNV